MRKRLLLALCFTMLPVACKRPERIVVQRVEVPVAVPCPEPPKPSRPASACALLTPDATPEQRAKALLADLTAWIGYALEEEKLLDGYRPATPGAPKK